MLNALTSAYSRKDYDNVKRGSPVETNIGKLFSVLSWGLEQVNEQAELVKLWDDIDYARGKVLDRYGANFGVSRFGATDAFYRLAIKVKLLTQLSGGDIDTIINAAASLFEVDPDKIKLAENFPAKIAINVDEAYLKPETIDAVVDIAAMLKRMTAAGVGLITTLEAYRELDGSTTIETAAFDHTKLEFDLPDARRQVDGETPITTAVIDYAQLKFGLPDVVRQTDGAENIETSAFARAGIQFGLPDVRRTVDGIIADKAIMLEYSRVVVRAVC